MVLLQLKQKDLKALKEKWHKEQNEICPLFGKTYPIDEMTLDHQHKLKSELPSEDGKGLCRGAIHFQANAIEGKITNAFKRYGGEKHINMVTFLRNLANYLEHNKSHEEEKWIHPSEAPRSPKLMKSSYNKLLKAIDGKQKVPEYNGKFTKVLQKLFEKYEVLPVLQ
jgi:hypothetical protein